MLVTCVCLDADNPLMRLAFPASCVIALKPSPTIVNSNQDSGSPCLRFFLYFISFPSPSVSIALVFVETNQFLIHLHHIVPNFLILSVSKMLSQFTLSYAFSKSNLRRCPLIFFFIFIFFFTFFLDPVYHFLCDDNPIYNISSFSKPCLLPIY